MNLFELSAVLSLNDTAFNTGMSRVKQVAQGAMALVGTAIVNGAEKMVDFGKDCIEAGKKFDSSMSQVMATMGYSVEELNDQTSEASKTMQTLSDFAQQMGSTTVFSASEAADALNYMALAGYDSEKSMAMLPNVLNLAAAGGIDLAAASDMVTDAQSALGLGMKQTELMVDQMAKTASKSNTSVAQLGEAFLTVGGTAKNLKGGTRELSQVLGLMADNGIKGSEAGTHLRNIMLSLNPTTEDAAEAFEALGLQAYDANGSLRPMSDIFGDLSAAMDGMTDEEKTNIISSIFNKTDISAVNALLATSADRWKELGHEIGNATGSAQAMAEVQLDNLEGDITLFQSALEGAQIAISNGLTPQLRNFVQFGSSAISELTEAFKENGMTGAFQALGGIIADGLQMALEYAPQFIEAGANLIVSIVTGIHDNLFNIIMAAVTIMNTLLDAAVENAPIIMEMAGEIISSLVKYILVALPRIFDAAVSIIETLGNDLGESLPQLIPTLVELILYIVQKITDPTSMNRILNAALQIMLGLANGIVNSIPQLVYVIPEVIGSLIATLISFQAEVGMAFTQVMVAVVQNLPAIIDSITKTIPYIIAAVIRTFKDPSFQKQFMDTGFNLFKGLSQGIANFFPTLVQNCKNSMQQLINTVKATFGIKSPSRVFMGIGDFLMQGLSNGIEDGAVDTIRTAESAMNDIIDSASGNQLDFGVTSSANFGGVGGTTSGGITMNIYGAEGQDVNELADIISRKLSNEVNRGRAVFA